MQLHSINAEQRLYVMPCGDGYSCYGFDVLDRKARAVAQWIIDESTDSHEKRAVSAWLARLPAPGSAAHFDMCSGMMDHGAEFNRRTGKRCPAELVPALIGLEGRRVECDYFGERKRFYVGKSTGWMPAHLLIKTANSTGGGALIADQVKNVRVIDGGRRRGH